MSPTDRDDRIYVNRLSHEKKRGKERKKKVDRRERRESDPTWRHCSLWRGTIVWIRTLVGRHRVHDGEIVMKMLVR